MALPIPEYDLEDIHFELLGKESIDKIRPVNRTLFKEERIINHYHHPDVILITASLHEVIVGFKLGYGRKDAFYSAKGGVLEPFRRKGVATRMLHLMLAEASRRNYKRFRFDTFPNRHSGMLILALNEGFRVTNALWNDYYSDFQIELEKTL
jgi:GNAT superfamily N-acetyltransferase